MATSASASTTNAAISAGAMVLSSAITAIASSGSKKAQIAALNLQGRVSQLTDQQQYALAVQLNSAKTDTDRLNILNSAISSIATATAQGNQAIVAAAATQTLAQQTTNNIVNVIVIGGAIAALIAAMIIINKKM